MDNQHRRYIAVLVLNRLMNILSMDRQHGPVSIYRWQYDYRLGIELPVHNHMDLDNVHSRMPNGMDNLDLSYIPVAHK